MLASVSLLRDAQLQFGRSPSHLGRNAEGTTSGLFYQLTYFRQHGVNEITCWFPDNEKYVLYERVERIEYTYHDRFDHGK